MMTCLMFTPNTFFIMLVHSFKLAFVFVNEILK